MQAEENATCRYASLGAALKRTDGVDQQAEANLRHESTLPVDRYQFALSETPRRNRHMTTGATT